MEQRLQVGVITATHGLKGEVKVFPTTDDPNRFRRLKEVILDTGKEERVLKIEGVKFFKQMVILKFQGLDDINDVERIRRGTLYVTRENAERLLDRVFGLENILASLWQTEDYNAAARRFEFPTGIGLNDSFAPYGLTCTRVNETTVSARFTMFSGANYGGPRNLGEYEILYAVLPVEEEPRLRFQSMLPVA